MIYRISNIIIIVWLLLSGSHTIIAKENITAKLVSNNVVDICGNTNSSVIVFIEIGEILKTDSLAGYNFEINYNPEKLKFHTALSSGTLTEGIQSKNFNFADTGKFYGYALKTTSLIEGNKPLIAFLGDYLGVCPDTAYVNISFIEFTEYFKKEVDSIENTFVKAEVFNKEDRFLSSEFESDSLIIPFEQHSISTNVILYCYKDSRVNSADFQISISDTSRFDIKSISSINDNIEIISFDKETNILKTSILSTFGTGDGFYIELNEKKKNDTIVELSVMPKEVNECSCITYFYGDSQFIRSEIKDTSTDYTEEEQKLKIEIFYNRELEEYIIRDKNLEIENITIMSIEGKQIMNKKIYNKLDEYKIEMNNFINGLYIVQIQNKEKIKNILLIKY